ncbi:MAG: phosphatase PAP2 family protein [Acidobacteria bacterium]|nr:phosphatase PAP2 family protein [Acidobacteriota bacterium]
MNLTLPALDSAKKWRWAAIGYLLFSVGYLLTGNLHLRAPTVLAPSGLDNFLPFTNWTIWIYHSQFVFLWLTFYLIQGAENLTRVVYSMALASLLSFGVFLIYPTIILRAGQLHSGLTASAWQFLYAVDSPSNCFPSLHVALAALAAMGIWREKKSAGYVAFAWALLIALSTMTTKQHYFIDVVGGLLIALFSYAVMKKISGSVRQVYR